MEVKIAPAAGLTPGEMKGYESQGQQILIANLSGSYYAIGDVCTHLGCTLSDGTLNGENVECPCHGSTFNVRSGAVVRGPAMEPEPSYKVAVEQGQIIISL